jgi:hypothetical protein
VYASWPFFIVWPFTGDCIYEAREDSWISHGNQQGFIKGQLRRQVNTGTFEYSRAQDPSEHDLKPLPENSLNHTVLTRRTAGDRYLFNYVFCDLPGSNAFGRPLPHSYEVKARQIHRIYDAQNDEPLHGADIDFHLAWTILAKAPGERRPAVQLQHQDFSAFIF